MTIGIYRSRPVRALGSSGIVPGIPVPVSPFIAETTTTIASSFNLFFAKTRELWEGEYGKGEHPYVWAFEARVNSRRKNHLFISNSSNGLRMDIEIQWDSITILKLKGEDHSFNHFIRYYFNHQFEMRMEHPSSKTYVGRYKIGRLTNALEDHLKGFRPKPEQNPVWPAAPCLARVVGADKFVSPFKLIDEEDGLTFFNFNVASLAAALSQVEDGSQKPVFRSVQADRKHSSDLVDMGLLIKFVKGEYKIKISPNEIRINPLKKGDPKNMGIFLNIMAAFFGEFGALGKQYVNVSPNWELFAKTLGPLVVYEMQLEEARKLEQEKGGE